MRTFILGLIGVSILIAFQNCQKGFQAPQAGIDLGSIGGGGSGSTVNDGNVPVAPTSLTLNIVSTSQINLTWDDNSLNETGFIIERAMSNGGPFTPATGPGAFSTIATTGFNVTSYSDMNLAPTTQYYYRVTATNSVGRSAATTILTQTTPAAPTTIPLAPSNLKATATQASIINLTWTDNSNNEFYFKIERSSDGVNFTLVANVSANTSTYDDINLVEQTAYTYRVKATNTLGDSTPSATSAATTLAAGNKVSYAYIGPNIVTPNCVYCHSPDIRSGGIDLSSISAVKGIGNALISSTQGGAMPPGAPLSAAQLTALQNWVAAGSPQ